MRKYLMFIFAFTFIVLFCNGCEGDVTRAIRHDGFNVGNNMVCEAFIGKNATERVWLFTGSHLITTEGRIYEVSLGQMYANKSNCRPAETSIQVVAIFDNKIVKATDGKYYSLVNQNNGSGAYQAVSTNDNSYAIYDLLLKSEGTIKVSSVDTSSGVYYVLKTDGNIYDVTVRKDNANSQPTIVGSTVVYNQVDYGGTIIDFNYNGNSGATFVRTENSAYHLKATNADQCTKYADIQCDYRMMELASFNEYSNYILAYNGSTIITTYGKIFNVAA